MNIDLDKRNLIGLGLLLLALAFLIPGLILDIFSIEVGYKLPLVGTKTTLHTESRSIMGTISFLFEDGNWIVAMLILLFSVLVPFAKLTGMLLVLLKPQFAARERVHHFINLIGKWSMADVFVVGVFIAYLSTSSMAFIEAEPESGFYYFTAYCILSIAGGQFVHLRPFVAREEAV